MMEKDSCRDDVLKDDDDDEETVLSLRSQTVSCLSIIVGIACLHAFSCETFFSCLLCPPSLQSLQMNEREYTLIQECLQLHTPSSHRVMSGGEVSLLPSCMFHPWKEDKKEKLLRKFTHAMKSGTESQHTSRLSSKK